MVWAFAAWVAVACLAPAMLFGRAVKADNPAPARRPTVPHAGKAPKEPILVSQVSVSRRKGGVVVIKIATTRAATFRVLRLADPDRLAIDLDGAEYPLPRKLIHVSSPVVRQVRAGQFQEKAPAVVRVVVDLIGDPLFEARDFTGGVRIEVRPRPNDESAANAPAPPRTVQAGGTVGREAKPQPKVESTAATPAPVQKSQPTRSVSMDTKPQPKTASVASPLPPPPTAQAVTKRDKEEPARSTDATVAANAVPTDAKAALEPARPKPAAAASARSPVTKRAAKNPAAAVSRAAPSGQALETPAQKPGNTSGLDDALRYLFGDGTPAPGGAKPQTNRPSPAPAKPPQETLVSDISVKPRANGAIAIELVMTQSAPFRVARIAQPDRLVIDIQGAINRCSRDAVPVTSPLVNIIRVAQLRHASPDAVRVVVGLTNNPLCQAHAYPGGVRVEVAPHP